MQYLIVSNMLGAANQSANSLEICDVLRLIPWLLLGSACTWFPHLESDPSVHESPGEECSSSEQRSAA